METREKNFTIAFDPFLSRDQFLASEITIIAITCATWFFTGLSLHELFKELEIESKGTNQTLYCNSPGTVLISSNFYFRFQHLKYKNVLYGSHAFPWFSLVFYGISSSNSGSLMGWCILPSSTIFKKNEEIWNVL